MQDDNAIEVRGLSKRYRIGLYEEMPDSLGEAIMNLLRFPVRSFRSLRKLTSFKDEEQEDIIWALKDISFEVKKGEVLGIIGKNGAGKSTLLKLLSRITTHTSGSALIKGRVNSLLEVGTGFHPELTGRDNVYLNGTILGMTRREVKSKFDQIVDFSGIGKFIDTPVKRYSSGMKVRLAFAVAAHLEPEVLIIDEVLAVGDAEFQRRCLGKMDEVAKSGRTVLFVSHNMNAVSDLCSRAILLKDGKMVANGNTDDIIGQYISIYNLDSVYTAGQSLKDRSGVQKVYAEQTGSGENNNLIYYSRPFSIIIEYKVEEPIKNWYVAINIRTLREVKVFTTADFDTNPELLETREPGNYRSVVEIPKAWLSPGKYKVVVFLINAETKEKIEVLEAIGFEVLDDGSPVKKYDMGIRIGLFQPYLNWQSKRIG